MSQNFLNLRIQLKPSCLSPWGYWFITSEFKNSTTTTKNPFKESYNADHASKTLPDIQYKSNNPKGLRNKTSYLCDWKQRYLEWFLFLIHSPLGFPWGQQRNPPWMGHGLSRSHLECWPDANCSQRMMLLRDNRCQTHPWLGMKRKE